LQAAVERDRKKKGIHPFVPPPEDRPAVAEEYSEVMEKLKNRRICGIQ